MATTFLYENSSTSAVQSNQWWSAYPEGIENLIINILNFSNILSVVVPILLSVAFMTIIERKMLAAMQRRLGPTDVGYFGVLQPFSDALKLILKESVVPAQSNKIIFYLAPVVTLVFSLLG